MPMSATCRPFAREFQGECGRCGHAVDENNVAVDVDDGDRDRYRSFHRLGSTRSAIFSR